MVKLITVTIVLKELWLVDFKWLMVDVEVIAGVFSGIIIDDMIILVVDYFSLVCLFFYFIPLNTLLWSLFKAIVLNDIKSIIALSTISLISCFPIVIT